MNLNKGKSGGTELKQTGVHHTLNLYTSKIHQNNIPAIEQKNLRKVFSSLEGV